MPSEHLNLQSLPYVFERDPGNDPFSIRSAILKGTSDAILCPFQFLYDLIYQERPLKTHYLACKSLISSSIRSNCFKRTEMIEDFRITRLPDRKLCYKRKLQIYSMIKFTF